MYLKTKCERVFALFDRYLEFYLDHCVYTMASIVPLIVLMLHSPCHT